MSKNVKPSVVAIGGGHGLATVLAALKLLDVDISAIVSVADDGGSSGMLSADYKMPPLGDIRRCISALAEHDNLLIETLESRFVGGALDNHPTGNLVLAGLLQTCGSLQTAIDELARITEAKGRVFPAAESSVTLFAKSDEGGLSGQVAIEKAIAQGTSVQHISAADTQVKAPPEAIAAIASADTILIGPGSFYTSVLGALLASNLIAAIEANSDARVVLIANISIDSQGRVDPNPVTQISLLRDHGVNVDLALAPSETSPPTENSQIVTHPILNSLQNRHDPEMLVKALTTFIWQD